LEDAAAEDISEGRQVVAIICRSTNECQAGTILTDFKKEASEINDPHAWEPYVEMCHERFLSIYSLISSLP